MRKTTKRKLSDVDPRSQVFMVAEGGLEPSTRGFSVHCYYQLSYPAKC